VVPHDGKQAVAAVFVFQFVAQRRKDGVHQLPGRSVGAEIQGEEAGAE
jgi:hypothetical protein